ncbi:PE family protein, partial [Mycobacterium marinum]
MTYLVTVPQTVATAAGNLAAIGSSITDASAAAAAPTTELAAAGADEISAAIAQLFGTHAQIYQRISAQAMAFHDQFARSLSAASGSYANAEATNTLTLQSVQQDLLGLVNAPTQALLGRPLIGNGANG